MQNTAHVQDVVKWAIQTKEHTQKSRRAICASDALAQTLIGLLQRHGRLRRRRNLK